MLESINFSVQLLSHLFLAYFSYNLTYVTGFEKRDHFGDKTLGRVQDPCANGVWLNKLTE